MAKRNGNVLMRNLQWLVAAVAVCLGHATEAAAAVEPMERIVAATTVAAPMDSQLHIRAVDGSDEVTGSRPLPRRKTPNVQRRPKRFSRIIERPWLSLCGLAEYGCRPRAKDEMTGRTSSPFCGSAVERCVFFCRFLL